jgi:hypothetical protein
MADAFGKESGLITLKGAVVAHDILHPGMDSEEAPVTHINPTRISRKPEATKAHANAIPTATRIPPARSRKYKAGLSSEDTAAQPSSTDQRSFADISDDSEDDDVYNEPGNAGDPALPLRRKGPK